jgi:hypothetical protein
VVTDVGEHAVGADQERAAFMALQVVERLDGVPRIVWRPGGDLPVVVAGRSDGRMASWPVLHGPGQVCNVLPGIPGVIVLIIATAVAVCRPWLPSNMHSLGNGGGENLNI